jgi:hypothetical protein
LSPEPGIAFGAAGFFFARSEMEKRKRWAIALCDKGMVHLHYGSGSLHILKENFVDLAFEVQRVADALGMTSQEQTTQNKKGLLH